MTEQIEKHEGTSLAAEYVLGLLTPSEARAFEDVLAVDPDLRDDYAAWAETFASYTNDIPAVAPPKRVEQQIKAAIWGETPKASFWSRFGLVGPMLAGGVAAIALLAVINQSDMFGADGPVYMAEIAAQDQSLVVQARFDSDSNTLAMTRDVGGAREGRSMEVWLIAGDNPPVSLGVWPQGEAETTLAVTADLAAQFDGGVLAISDEPIGGSPTGQPTGDVMAVGQVSLI